MKTVLGVIFGGASHEHAVSLRSAETIFQQINYEFFEVVPLMITFEGKWVKYANLTAPIKSIGELWIDKESDTSYTPTFNNEVDICLSVIHGETGEDGKLQGFLEMLGATYIGCGVEASALSMNKILAKEVANKFGGVKVVPYQVFHKEEYSQNKMVQLELEYPVFVKPARAGSSVGISKVYNQNQLDIAFEVAFKIDDVILVEQFVKGKEIEVGIIGHEKLEASRVGEISFTSDFYDYDNKYLTDNSTMHIPARIDEDLQEKTQEYAKKIFRSIGCKGYSRIDFFIEDETNEIYFNEINTSPGMTTKSMFPVLFGDKYTFSDLLTNIINEELKARKLS